MINFELLVRDKYQKNGLFGVNLGEGKVTKGYPIDDVHHYQAKMCKYASHVPKVNYCKFLCYICLLIVSGSIMRIIFTYFPSSSLKRGASSRWSIDPNSTWSEYHRTETRTTVNKHPTLQNRWK